MNMREAFETGYEDGYNEAKREHQTQICQQLFYEHVKDYQPDYIGLFEKPNDRYPEYVMDTNMSNWCNKIKGCLKSTRGTMLKLIRYTPAGLNDNYRGLLTVQDSDGDINRYFVKFR